jgi:hypothetical protein
MISTAAGFQRSVVRAGSFSVIGLRRRGGRWKCVAMVVRYEHASEERDALLAQAPNPYASGGTWQR